MAGSDAGDVMCLFEEHVSIVGSLEQGLAGPPGSLSWVSFQLRHFLTSLLVVI